MSAQIKRREIKSRAINVRAKNRFAFLSPIHFSPIKLSSIQLSSIQLSPISFPRPWFSAWMLLLSLTLLAPTVVFAQKTITRDQALKASLETASILAAQARVSAAEAQAIAANIPISGTANIGYAWTGVDPKPSNGDAIKGDWNYGAQLNFTGLFGEAGNGRVLAGLSLERSRLGFSAALLRANQSAINLWHGLRRSQANLETAQAAKELSEAQDRASESRLQSGAINTAEREVSRVALQSAQLELAKAQNRLEAARVQLEILLGLSSESTGGQAGGQVSDWQVLPLPPEAANLERREDVFEARSALINAELEFARSQRAAWPTLNLDAGLQGSGGNLGLRLNSDLASGLTYGSTGNAAAGISGNGAGQAGSGSTSWNLGLSLNIPLDPGKLVALPALEQSVRAAQAALQANQRAAKADVAAKRAALVLARSGLKLGERQLELSSQNLERSRQRLTAGVIPALEVKRAELERLKARDALLGTQADLDAAVLDVFEALNLPVLNPPLVTTNPEPK
jgi:outer membrane protein TolC